MATDLAFRHRGVVMPVQPMETEIQIERGEGSYLIDTAGKRYLDLATGIAVNAIGYCHPAVLAAIDAQSRRFLHVYSGTGYQDVLLDYAEALVSEVGAGHQIFFGNSGTEGIEAAIKLARFATGRPALISFRGGFHGRSLGALSLTDSAARYRSPYEPLLPSVYHLEYPAPTRLGLTPDAALKRVQDEWEALLASDVAPDRVALVVVEAVQGEGGYVIPPQGFLPWLRRETEKHGILLAIDEVQSGMGRTGRMFAYQHAGISPDIVVMGKAVGGGLPLSAIAARTELAGTWSAGAHGSTFGGNPLSLATGLATYRVIKEEGLMERAAELGAVGLERLGATGDPSILDVRGLGLMVAVEFAGERAAEIAQGVMADSLAAGVILHTAGLKHQVIRLMPPYNIDRDVWDAALEGLSSRIRRVADRLR